MIDEKLTYNYILTLIVAVFFTWIIHEFAHWLTSELLGYETIMRLNGTSPATGAKPTDFHSTIISAAGPIATIFQGLIAFLIIMKRNWNKYIYAFLFTAFYMRVLAGLMNFINPNDEGRISAFLGIGTFTLPIVVSGFLFFLVYKISGNFSLKRKFHLWSIVIVMIISSILILFDQFFKLRNNLK